MQTFKMVSLIVFKGLVSSELVRYCFNNLNLLKTYYKYPHIRPLQILDFPIFAHAK